MAQKSGQKKLEEILAMSALKEEIKKFPDELETKAGGKWKESFRRTKAADRRSPGTCS